MTLQTEIQDETPSKLSLRHVSKRFRTGGRTVHALDDVSLEIGEGEFVCLVGPSGCGKSTLLNIIAGLEKADDGQVLTAGVPITAPGRDRMVMFQEAALFPWLDVLDNVLFGLKLKPGLTRAERVEVAQFYLKLVGLENFTKAYIHELSGGMKQRVALARSLAPNPRVLLMDEPFAALDALTRRRMQDELMQLWEETKFTVLFVTHSIPEAVRIGNRILLLSPHPGQVKGELNSDGRDAEDANGMRLSDRIHSILFSGEKVESEGAHV